ncbi:MAG: DUF2948 family protein [Hyphomicrobiaceae bacterium]|nr:DUF2948 family protein [Hyphomicrobiaceae bacterium]
MPELKLIALDADDLGVLSTHVQDAVVRAGDIAYDAAARRLAMVINRFDWLEANRRRLVPRYARRRAGLRFEKVARVRSTGINRERPDDVLALLALGFTVTDPPSGRIILTFSGGPRLELEVECIEAELKDLGAAWATARKPRHGGA